MDIHYSEDYYWADSTGRRIAFNELNYPDWKASAKALDELKAKTKGIHAVPYTYRDIDTIKADFLIENVERAFESWKRSPNINIPFEDFCEYILPYRVATEPLQNWRSVYTDFYKSFRADGLSVSNLPTLKAFGKFTNEWFANSYGWGSRRNEPLPRLGPLQLLHRKHGPCEDMANLSCYGLRALGIPSALSFVPFWATASNAHLFNTVFEPDMTPKLFDLGVAEYVGINGLKREPAKVITLTFSKQKSALASFTPVADIPQGFMRLSNYIDHTNIYWDTKDVVCSLVRSAGTPKVAYACVFNTGAWRPCWWGKVQADSVTFTNMAKGAVYLPACYINGKLSPAGYPVAQGYNHFLVLKPDLNSTRAISINQEEKYLIFRPGKRYKLYYWDFAWKLVNEEVFNDGDQNLRFENVPLNALLLLKPEYSEGKERPFMVTSEGNRIWW